MWRTGAWFLIRDSVEIEHLGDILAGSHARRAAASAALLLFDISLLIDYRLRRAEGLSDLLPRELQLIGIELLRTRRSEVEKLQLIIKEAYAQPRSPPRPTADEPAEHRDCTAAVGARRSPFCRPPHRGAASSPRDERTSVTGISVKPVLSSLSYFWAFSTRSRGVESANFGQVAAADPAA
jgi:hypothetical protein